MEVWHFWGQTPKVPDLQLLKEGSEELKNKNQNPASPISLRFRPPFALLHGGLGDGVRHRVKVLKSLQRIGKKVQTALNKSAVDLSVIAVQELEADPLFNSGFGARLQTDGVARLSASLMEGRTQQIVNVSNVEGIIHPSRIVLDLLREEKISLAGIEASRFAFAHGQPPRSAITAQRYQEWIAKQNGRTGTVGCVSIDSRGDTAACTSTGGRGFEIPGRVSDSSSPAGNFASPYGAVSCTGVGEHILNASVASSILTRLEDGFPLAEAVRRSFLRHHQLYFGLIALTRDGTGIVASTRGEVSFALVTKSAIHVGFAPSDWEKTISKAASIASGKRSR